MEDEDEESNFFEWFKRQDESIPLIEWDGWESIGILIIVIISSCINIICKGLIIHYTWNYAPKGRPLNALILFEQVGLDFFSLFQKRYSFFHPSDFRGHLLPHFFIIEHSSSFLWNYNEVPHWIRWLRHLPCLHMPPQLLPFNRRLLHVHRSSHLRQIPNGEGIRDFAD